MRRVILRVFLLAIILTVTSGCAKNENKEQLAAATVEEVRQTIEAFGSVQAKDVKNIIMNFPAIVEKVFIREGQKVKMGDTLITLNMKEYKDRLVNKELELKAVQNEINLLISSKNGSGPDILKLYNDMENAESLYNKAVKELSDKEALFKAGSIPQYELDEFKKSVDAKKKAVGDIRFSISGFKNSTQLTLDQKLNNVKLLESEITLMKENLTGSYIKENNIVADIPKGVVFDIGYKIGDNISSKKKVLSILNLDSLFIEADVSEDFIKDVKIGAETVIIPAADKLKQYKGKVIAISNKAVKTGGDTNVKVEISIENRDEFLLPDYNVDVKISK